MLNTVSLNRTPSTVVLGLGRTSSCISLSSPLRFEEESLSVDFIFSSEPTKRFWLAPRFFVLLHDAISNAILKNNISCLKFIPVFLKRESSIAHHPSSNLHSPHGNCCCVPCCCSCNLFCSSSSFVVALFFFLISFASFLDENNSFNWL